MRRLITFLEAAAVDMACGGQRGAERAGTEGGMGGVPAFITRESAAKAWVWGKTPVGVTRRDST